MNGIHEVTGSIPVWSTNLRSVYTGHMGDEIIPST